MKNNDKLLIENIIRGSNKGHVDKLIEKKLNNILIKTIRKSINNKQ